MMTTTTGSDLSTRADATTVPCYGTPRIAMVRGAGCRLEDADGRRYLDLLSGLGAAALGHAHPALRAALADQAGRLVHCSNLFVNEPQVELAEWLCAHSFAERAFFCNSGAEAIEAAIKLARANDDPRRRTIVALEGSFHGRTYGALSITGQEKLRTGFEPVLPDVVHVPAGDPAAIDRAIDERTAAVVLEPIQGEGGVHPIPDDVMRLVRECCTERGALVVCDEVQCGMGRTGELLAHTHAGITPDAVALGKALGGGVPIAALITTAAAGDRLGPGRHGTTYGGNPLACAAALAVCRLLDGGLLEQVRARGAQLHDGLMDLVGRFDRAQAVRGRGLMLGLALTDGAKALATDLLERGVIVNAIRDDTIRLLPPFVITEDEVDEGLAALAGGLERLG